MDVIEDVIPLYKVNVRVKAPGSLREVAVVPEGALLPFRMEGPYAVFELDRIDGHAMVSLAFGERFESRLEAEAVKTMVA